MTDHLTPAIRDGYLNGTLLPDQCWMPTHTLWRARRADEACRPTRRRPPHRSARRSPAGAPSSIRPTNSGKRTWTAGWMLSIARDRQPARGRLSGLCRRIRRPSVVPGGVVPCRTADSPGAVAAAMAGDSASVLRVPVRARRRRGRPRGADLDCHSRRGAAPANGCRRAAAPRRRRLRPSFARLDDAGGPISLRADGQLDGLPPLSEPERAAVLQALQQGRLPSPVGLGDVITKGQTLMGDGPQIDSFAPVAPLATAVESDRPEFAWRPAPGATSYVVAVYDDQFSLALESPPVTTTSWRASSAIRRGRVYLAGQGGDREGSPGGAFSRLRRKRASRSSRRRRPIGSRGCASSRPDPGCGWPSRMCKPAYSTPLNASWKRLER